MIMDTVPIFIACSVTAWLFASAAWTKLRAPLRMAGVIDNYRLLPFYASQALVRLLAGIELITAFAVLLPSTRQWGAVAAAILLMIYAGAIAINLVRGRTDIDCGCTSTKERKIIGPSLLWRNAVLIVIACIAALPLAERPLAGLDYLVAILTTAFIIVLYQIVERLLVNHQQLAKL